MNCDRCRKPLCKADLLCGAETCSDCERRALTVRDEWSVFLAALRKSVRDDGTVHQCDVRPLIRGKVAPKSIGTFYRRAKSCGLIVDTGQIEPSSDTAGRNSDKFSRIYRWKSAA